MIDPEEMLQDLLESPRLYSFSKWEQDFLASIQEEVDVGNFLTDKQKNKVNDIHNKYFG